MEKTCCRFLEFTSCEIQQQAWASPDHIFCTTSTFFVSNLIPASSGTYVKLVFKKGARAKNHLVSAIFTALLFIGTLWLKRDTKGKQALERDMLTPDSCLAIASLDG